jgi:hypothetical protein
VGSLKLAALKMVSPAEAEHPMNTDTRLEPLSTDRAQHLFDLMRQLADDPNTALSLDDGGCVIGVVAADAPRERHLLGDLDVHA